MVRKHAANTPQSILYCKYCVYQNNFSYIFMMYIALRYICLRSNNKIQFVGPCHSLCFNMQTSIMMTRTPISELCCSGSSSKIGLIILFGIFFRIKLHLETRNKKYEINSQQQYLEVFILSVKFLIEYHGGNSDCIFHL